MLAYKNYSREKWVKLYKSYKASRDRLYRKGYNVKDFGDMKTITVGGKQVQMAPAEFQLEYGRQYNKKYARQKAESNPIERRKIQRKSVLDMVLRDQTLLSAKQITEKADAEGVSFDQWKWAHQHDTAQQIYDMFLEQTEEDYDAAHAMYVNYFA